MKKLTKAKDIINALKQTAPEDYKEIKENTEKVKLEFRGGYRPNAGRKCIGSTPRKITIRVTDAEKAELFRVKDVQLHLRKAVLKCGNDDASLNQRDFSRFADSAAADFSPENTPDYTFTGGGQTKMFVRSYQVDDPRLNHYPSDWKTKKDYFATTEDDGKTTGYPGTRGAINAGVNPSTVSDGDKEKATDPAATGDHTPALSTAYIRHAPMESLWELGAISRAEKWKTLNLSRTDTTTFKLGQVSGGGGEYKNGDGAILDQVKLTSRIASYGKVNLNTNAHGVLHALFANVKVGKDLTYDDYTGGTNYSLTEHATVDDNCLLCKIASISSHTPLKTRAELLAAEQTHTDGNVKTLLEAISDKLLKPSNADPETDREREQLIGKVINLTKAESSNEINVIVLAQTIKDIGPETGTITIQKNWGSTDDLRYRRAGYLRPPRQTETNPKSTRLNLPSGFALSENATITDKKRGQYKNGADQITGEAKLVVILYNDSGIWKIRRYEYAQ